MGMGYGPEQHRQHQDTYEQPQRKQYCHYGIDDQDQPRHLPPWTGTVYGLEKHRQLQGQMQSPIVDVRVEN